jgi:hypothetical protein
MNGRLAVCLMVASLWVAPGVGAQVQAFGRLEAGTLNARDPFNTTLAFGGAVGITVRSSSFVLRLVRQSWNRNSGADVSDGRTFALLDWEWAGKPKGAWQRQPFIRLGAGWLFQSPFKSTGATDLGVGLRYKLASRLFVVGALVDQVAWVQPQVFTDCQATICTTTNVPEQIQHNLGLLVDLELRP